MKNKSRPINQKALYRVYKPKDNQKTPKVRDHIIWRGQANEVLEVRNGIAKVYRKTNNHNGFITNLYLGEWK